MHHSITMFSLIKVLLIYLCLMSHVSTAPDSINPNHLMVVSSLFTQRTISLLCCSLYKNSIMYVLSDIPPFNTLTDTIPPDQESQMQDHQDRQGRFYQRHIHLLVMYMFDGIFQDHSIVTIRLDMTCWNTGEQLDIKMNAARDFCHYINQIGYRSQIDMCNGMLVITIHL
jgi:hypothetical protein